MKTGNSFLRAICICKRLPSEASFHRSLRSTIDFQFAFHFQLTWVVIPNEEFMTVCSSWSVRRILRSKHAQILFPHNSCRACYLKSSRFSGWRSMVGNVSVNDSTHRKREEEGPSSVGNGRMTSISLLGLPDFVSSVVINYDQLHRW